MRGGRKHNQTTALRYLSGLQATELRVMDAAVRGVNDDPRPLRNFVDLADPEHASNEGGLARSALEQRQGGGAAVEPHLLQRPVHHLELVGALAKLPQPPFQMRIE